MLTLGTEMGLAEVNCTDFKKQMVASGQRYIPLGFDACTTCTCQNGNAELCISVMCSPPKDCQNSQLSDDKCCEFMCKNGDLERPPLFNVTTIGTKDADALNPTNLGLRLVASTVTSFLILALLLFMIHRLRQRRLLLMIRRINNEHINGFGCRRGRLSVEEDRTVGYFPDRDHIDFGLYEDPPPPYPFWKPPESYFPQGEAPPPYEADPPSNGYIPHSLSATHATTPGLAPCMGLPLQIPSLSSVPLHANNFQMNDLGQDSSVGQPRHSLPLDHLNVMCSMSSLSSQSELNLNETNANNSDNMALALRSDATYEDCPSYAVSNGGSSSNGRSNCNLMLGSHSNSAGRGVGVKGEQRVNNYMTDVGEDDPNRVASAHKCHSYNNVLDCWQQDKTPDNKLLGDLKRRSLQATGVGHGQSASFYPDPTAWNGEASESSSSSTPTYEQRTVSPTSSDSSSLDYHFPSSNLDRSRLVALPRRANSDNQVRQARLVPTSKPSGAVVTTTAAASTSTAEVAAPLTNSLDRTLNHIKQKISLKKKKHKKTDASAKRTSDSSNGADVTEGVHARMPLENIAPIPGDARSTWRSRSHDATPEELHESGSLQNSSHRVPRISYVSEGDVNRPSETSAMSSLTLGDNPSSALSRGSRPKSYDFGDLSTATYTLSEEMPSTAVTVSGSDGNKSELESRTDCCCSFSSDHLYNSGSMGSVTCSSRASFGSSASSPSRDGPVTQTGLRTPGADNGSSIDQAGTGAGSLVVASRPARNPLSPSAPIFPYSQVDAMHLRSASVCSETGERKHGSAQASVPSPVGEASGTDSSLPSNANSAASTSNEVQRVHGRVRPGQQIRINLGPWKQNQESYI